MSFKVILAVFLCGICACFAMPSPLPVPKYDLPGDDKTNWEELWNATKNDPIVSRSGDLGQGNVFDMIVRINARARGNGTGRSDENVFLFEGDIKMNKREAISIIKGSQGTSRQKRAVMRNNGRNLWQKNKIAYVIDSSLYHVRRNVIGGIAEWERTLMPCMGKWKDVTSISRPSRPRDYMNFFRGGGCYSQVGRVGGGQRVSIGNGCQQHGVVVHEIGHAMGLWHEQSRPDRDKYVTILWNNIIPAMKFNFQKHSKSRVNSLGVAYDYDSVMHYGAYAFSRRRGAETIRSKTAGRKLGQRAGLSAGDKKQVKLLYGCTKQPVKPTVGPRPPSGCQTDVQTSKNCNHWKSQGYCHRGKHVKYMQKNCCKTCKGVTVPSRCVDKETKRNCHYWKSKSYCVTGKWISYMKTNCCQTCRSATVQPSCVDKQPKCQYWKSYCVSFRWVSYMKKYCCQTCRT